MKAKRLTANDRLVMQWTGILLMGCLLSGAAWAQPRDWYVVTNEVAVSDGESWDTAYTNLQAVFDLVGDGDTVYLAGHVFEGTSASEEVTVFSLANVTNITIRGGYQGVGDPGEPDPDQWPTVLRRAGGHARVMTLTSVSNVVFEQITFRDGRWTTDGDFHAGGLYLDNCHDLVFDGCAIINNYISTSDSTHRDGGGIYLSGSTVALYNSVVNGNTNRATSGHSQRRGAGVFVNGTSRLKVTNTVMRGNRSTSNANGNSFGGAVFVASGGHLDMQNSMLIDNVSERRTAHASWRGFGGALSNYGTALLRNVLITGNRSCENRGDGVFSHGASAKTVLVNCTVADNDNGRGLEYGGGTFAVTNTIVWGHTDDLRNFPTDGEGRLLNVSHSLFATADTMDDVEGCKTGDPLFVDVSTRDYRLQRGSPAIDTGLNLAWMQGATDLAGMPRIMMGRVDMGCYETIPPRGTLFLVK